MPGFDINEFKANVLNTGVLKNNLYLVNFIATPFENNLIFLTSQVNLPSVQMDTQMIARYGYGPIEQVPYRPVFSPLTMNFMVEANQINVITTMLNYMTNTVSFMNYNSVGGASGSLDVFGAGGTAFPYEVAYKSDFEFTLQVYLYDEANNQVITYTFNQCYVLETGSVSLSWDNQNQLLTVPITFQYTDYSVQNINVNSGEIDSTVGLTSLQSQLGLPSLFDTINAIQAPQQILNLLSIANASSFLS